jgi:serine/threonine-protein kinase
MRARTYVHPGTHAGGPSGPAPAPIYGSRWRLKSSFNAASFNPAAKVVIAALKKYGMFLADGGNIALTAQADDFTAAKWAKLNFDALSLSRILPSDFDVVQTSSITPSRITVTNSCVRNNLPKLTCNSTTFFIY